MHYWPDYIPTTEELYASREGITLWDFALSTVMAVSGRKPGGKEQGYGKNL